MNTTNTEALEEIDLIAPYYGIATGVISRLLTQESKGLVFKGAYEKSVIDSEEFGDNLLLIVSKSLNQNQKDIIGLIVTAYCRKKDHPGLVRLHEELDGCLIDKKTDGIWNSNTGVNRWYMER